MNTEKKVFIIAEAGVNHNGSLVRAKKMIEVAAKIGADAIKFQIYKTDKLVTKNSPKAKYQLKSSNKNESQFNMLKKYEFNEVDFRKIYNHCKLNKIEFMASPFDLESLNFLLSLNIDKIKIPSGEIDNLPLLIKIAKTNKNTILSTGMSTLKEIETAINILLEKGLSKKKLTVLHCTTKYPTNYRDVNLNVIHLLNSKFKLNIGYSDHTRGIIVPIAAVALGAKIIEKHFTLNNKLKGPDHISSLEPNEFEKMVLSIRNTTLSLGLEKKIITREELDNKKKVRKSIYALTNIKKGDLFTENNLICKRPANGFSPMKWYKLLNTVAKENYKKDDLIK